MPRRTAALGIIFILIGSFLVLFGAPLTGATGSVLPLAVTTVDFKVCPYNIGTGVLITNPPTPINIVIQGPNSGAKSQDSTGCADFPQVGTGTYTITGTDPSGTYCAAATGTCNAVTATTSVSSSTSYPLGFYKHTTSSGWSFSLGLNPQPGQAIPQGGSLQLYVILSVTSGTASPVTLSSSCASGLTCGSFTANPITPPDSSHYLPVSASSSTAPGNYQVTVTGTATGATQQSSSITIIVQAVTSFDFSMSNNGPISLYAPTSGSNTGGIAVTATLNTGAPTQQIALTYSGSCPSGSQCGFGSSFASTSSGNPTFAVTFQMTAIPTTPGGAYSFTVTGSGGGKSHSTTLTFNIIAVPAFDFSISVGGSSSIVQGQTETISIGVSLQSGTASGNPVTVSLSSGSCPPSSQCTLSSQGPSTVPFTAYYTIVTNQASTTPGTYTFSFSATGGGKTHGPNSFSFQVTQYVAPTVFDFTMSTPSAVSVNYPSVPTAQTTVTLTLTPSSTTTANVAVSVNGCPIGTTCSGSSGSPTFTSTITVTITSTTPAGAYTVTVTGTGGGQSHSVSFQLTVTTTQFDFSLTVPNPNAVQAGQTTTTTATVGAVSGSGTVTLNIQNVGTACPPQASCTLNPTSGTPTFQSILTISTNTATPAGTYQLIINAIGGTHQYQTTVTVTVIASPFDFSVTGTLPPPVSQGGTVTSTITVQTTLGTALPVNLQISGCPSSSTCTLSASSGTPTFTSTLTIVVGTGTPANTYQVTVTGTSGSRSHPVILPFQVTAAVTCDTSQPVVQITFTDTHGSQIFNNPSGTYTLDPTFTVSAIPLQAICTITDIQVVWIPWQDSFSSNPPRGPVTNHLTQGAGGWTTQLSGTAGSKYYLDVGVQTTSGASWALSALKMDFTSGTGTVTLLNYLTGTSNLWAWFTAPITLFGFGFIVVGLFMMVPSRRLGT